MCAFLKYVLSFSIPMLLYPIASAAANVEPAPAKVSTITPSPSGSTPRISFRKKSCGLRLGCGAQALSFVLVGDEAITSPKGLSGPGRRNPPVFHFLRLSCTLPSMGFLNSTHGSHIERGITLTSLNSSWAAFGRSPPRMVMTSRMISPRRSSPASDRADDTMCDNNGFDATTTFAPGTNLGRSKRAQRKKNEWS